MLLREQELLSGVVEPASAEDALVLGPIYGFCSVTPVSSVHVFCLCVDCELLDLCEKLRSTTTYTLTKW